ncbi:hypothetical protein IT412_02410 [Candidatus Peregrinibacteria bacterium]|nr:hypothetical protein [Candidatus Peregrinibacteria bacterium]
MKSLLKNLFHLLVLLAVAVLLFVTSFFYEQNFSRIEALKFSNQVVLDSYGNGKIMVKRQGIENEASVGYKLEEGDVVETLNQDNFYLRYGGDGLLRLDKNTQLILEKSDLEKSHFIFNLVSGRGWLNNLYSNASLNITMGQIILLPGQSVVYLTNLDGKSDFSAQQGNLKLLFTKSKLNDFVTDDLDQRIINKLLIPQGTVVTVYYDKVKDNIDTIAKLLFSKLVKEFNYSVFDENLLISDEWLSRNVEKDLSVTTQIRDSRLKKIRTKGLKYSSLDAVNYKLDQWLRDASNAITFSDKKVGDRNLEALYDFLYDAQYLFDYGRKEEAQERLNNFNATANQLFVLYCEQLKEQYRERVKHEYDYLSFANPGDSLFGLKLVLEKIYLDSLEGTSIELTSKFDFLTEKANVMAYYAENKDYKNLKNSFQDYMVVFKELVEKNAKKDQSMSNLVQQQNQILDNLFILYPDFYRQDLFTNKLFVENKYLSLLPVNKDKIEETQTVIAQRITFLKRLQEFFLDGEVPLIDAQNIVALLFTEISKIDLPKENLAAVTGLFNERLQDYGVFSRFLNSPEYVNSNQKGGTPRMRFESFKKDTNLVISIEELRGEFSNQLDLSDQPNEIEMSSQDIDQTEVPIVNEDLILQNIDGEAVVKDNTTVISDDEVKPVKVPRVKRPN